MRPLNPLVMETDLGRDPDDLFALLYFIGRGVPLRALCVSPGDHDQVAVIRAVLHHFGLRDVPVLTPRAREVKKSITPFHEWVARQLGAVPGADGFAAAPDGHEDALPNEPVDVFVCGPARMAHLLHPLSITFQGGFVPYSRHRPTRVPVLEKFVGAEAFATFNLGGTKPPVHDALIAAAVPHRWVGKNVCHTVVYDRAIHERYCPKSGSEALRLHRVFIEHYLDKHEQKAFHDPLAALLHYESDLGVWLPLKPRREKGKWTAVPLENEAERHLALVDLVADEREPWARYFAGLSAS